MAVTTSTTEINAIDQTYPVAGQDNDSQGFRDNFSNIKTSLTKVKADLDALDTNTAKLNVSNDFNGNQISEADFKATTEVAYTIGNVSASQNINWSNGNYQVVQVGNNLTLTLTDWPATGKLAKLRVVVTSDGSSRTVTWNAGGSGDIKFESTTGNEFPTPFTVASTDNPKIVDFWTSNGGSQIYAKYVGEFT